jgi:DNA invertase Pin-like site-specific DNA recombinase
MGEIMGRLIGYARVSAPGRLLDLQINELKAAGCKKIFIDKTSGYRAERPGLNHCLKTLRAGDTLIVWRLDRLGRSTAYFVPLIKKLKQRRIAFKSLMQRD